MNIKKIAVTAAPIVLTLGIAAAAFAQPTTVQGPSDAIRDIAGFLNVIRTVTNLVFTALIALSVVYIILAAFQFITGGGDPAAVQQARNKLIWAGVGIIVALLARAVPYAIASALGTPLI